MLLSLYTGKENHDLFASWDLLSNTPMVNKRDRLWTAPDILTISENDYINKFRHYHLPQKEQMNQWNVRQSTGKKNVSVDGQDSVDISSIITDPGYYKLTWKWKDVEGNPLEIIQYVMIYDESKLLPGNEVIQVNYQDKNYIKIYEKKILSFMLL